MWSHALRSRHDRCASRARLSSGELARMREDSRTARRLWASVTDDEIAKSVLADYISECSTVLRAALVPGDRAASRARAIARRPVASRRMARGRARRSRVRSAARAAASSPNGSSGDGDGPQLPSYSFVDRAGAGVSGSSFATLGSDASAMMRARRAATPVPARALSQHILMLHGARRLTAALSCLRPARRARVRVDVAGLGRCASWGLSSSEGSA